jgi:hypothetical protein
MCKNPRTAIRGEKKRTCEDLVPLVAAVINDEVLKTLA